MSTRRGTADSDAGIDLTAVLSGAEVDLPAGGATTATPASETIDLSGLWSQMVFADESSLDALLGATGDPYPVISEAASTGLPPLAAWLTNPLPETPGDY